MREIVLFVEDAAHQQFLSALVVRVAEEFGICIQMHWRNARRGSGAVIRELREFIRDLQRDHPGLPDMLIVASDANCKGMQDRLAEIVAVTAEVSTAVICAVPDPHIERWLLLDSAAFKKVFGRGCKAPDQKCERDRYKKLLMNAILEAGITPSFGGIEFAEEIVKAMDIDRVGRNDYSLGKLLTDLQTVFRQWQHEGN